MSMRTGLPARAVGQDVIGTELTVDQAVGPAAARSWRRARGAVRKPGPRVSDPRDTRRGLSQVGERTGQDHGRAGPARGGAAAGDGQELAEGVRRVGVQRAQHFAELLQDRRRAAGLGLDDVLQRRARHVLDHGGAGRIVLAAGVGQVEPGSPDAEPAEPVMSGAEQVQPAGVRERVSISAADGAGIRREPVVLARVPDVHDRRGSAVQDDAVDALLAGAAQPAHVPRPGASAEG